jgi:hypothetical protein
MQASVLGRGSTTQTSAGKKERPNVQLIIFLFPRPPLSFCAEKKHHKMQKFFLFLLLDSRGQS